MENSKKIIEHENNELCKLININEDACEFYSSAQEKADDPQIRKTFQNLEKLHRGVIVNLQQHVRANGGDAKARETMTGQAAQFWGSLMTSISNDVDETLVNNLEEAEDRCLHSIEDALKEPDFRSATKDILIHEKSTLQRSHDYMKTLKDTLRAA